MPCYLLFLSDKVHLVAIRAIFKVQHSGLENRSINVRSLCLTIVPLEIHPPTPNPGLVLIASFAMYGIPVYSVYSGNPIQHSELCTIHYATCHMHYALDVTHLLLVIQFLSATLVFSTTLAMRCLNTVTNRDVLPTLVK